MVTNFMMGIAFLFAGSITGMISSKEAIKGPWRTARDILSTVEIPLQAASQYYLYLENLDKYGFFKGVGAANVKLFAQDHSRRDQTVAFIDRYFKVLIEKAYKIREDKLAQVDENQINNELRLAWDALQEDTDQLEFIATGARQNSLFTKEKWNEHMHRAIGIIKSNSSLAISTFSFVDPKTQAQDVMEDNSQCKCGSLSSEIRVLRKRKVKRVAVKEAQD